MLFQERERSVEYVKVLEDEVLGIKGQSEKKGPGRVKGNTKPTGHCSKGCCP